MLGLVVPFVARRRGERVLRWTLASSGGVALLLLSLRAEAQLQLGLDAVDETPAVSCSFPCYAHTFFDVGVGRGLRFNNPYRLQTPLGSDASSVSVTASTLDFKIAGLLGDPFGWHQGMSLAASLSLQGVPQQVITPSYQLAYPLSGRFWWRGHLGAAIVTQPDANIGFELGSGLVGLVRAGLGVHLGLVYAQFWGAATPESGASPIPILAGQLAATLQYEVLP